MPLQMARPSPVPVRPASRSPSSSRANFLNSSGIRSGAIPSPSSATVNTTSDASCVALTLIAVRCFECLAALESRLPTTCTMRRLSAMTRGSSGPTSRWMLLAPPRAPEQPFGLVQQRRRGARFGEDGQGAGLDAGHVEQVADQAAHAPGLLRYDLVELPRLRRVRRDFLVEQGRGGLLDGGQRHLQLVARYGHELGAQAFFVIEGRDVLQGHDTGGRLALFCGQRRGVEERGEAAAVGDVHDDFFEGDAFAGVEGLRDGVQAAFAPVGAPAAHLFEQLPEGAAGQLQAVQHSACGAVEGEGRAGLGVEEGDSDRRGVEQGLQRFFGAALGAAAAGVVDDCGGLGGDGEQGLFVLCAERAARPGPGDEDVAEGGAALLERDGEKGERAALLQARVERRQALRFYVLVQVGQAQGRGSCADVVPGIPPPGAAPTATPFARRSGRRPACACKRRPRRGARARRSARRSGSGRRRVRPAGRRLRGWVLGGGTFGTSLQFFAP